jgi:3-hydroxybutyryl-CoA dehydratase
VTPTLQVKRFEDLAVGDRVTFTKTISETDIYLFAGITGDFYPLHMDAEYAKHSRFGERVAHGMLVGSLISTVNGLLLGVGGGISLGQTLRFRRPVKIGDTITAEAEIVEKIPTTRRLRFRTVCRNQRGEIVVEGEALEMKDEGP